MHESPPSQTLDGTLARAKMDAVPRCYGPYDWVHGQLELGWRSRPALWNSTNQSQPELAKRIFAGCCLAQRTLL